MKDKKYGTIIQGNIIRNERKRKLMSQKDLAEKMNVDQCNITLWEQGKRRVPEKHVRNLCKILGISLKKFMEPYYKQCEESSIEYFDPKFILSSLLNNDKFSDKERFDNEYESYLSIIVKNFKNNGYELIAKKTNPKNLGV